ncbi:S24 family peptidase [Rhodothalassium salexigens]|nr:S24 family peptidase [Rhodothalassium salexigens]
MRSQLNATQRILGDMTLEAERLRAALERYMKAYGLNKSAWARAAGIRESTLRNFLKGDSQSLTYTTLAKLAAAAEDSIGNLIGEANAGPPPSPPTPDMVPAEYVSIPKLESYLGAGNGGPTTDTISATTLFPRALIEDELRAKPSDIVAMQILGDSMSPMLEHGDQVLIDMRMKDPAQPGAFAIRMGDSFMARIIEPIYGSDPPAILLRPRNAFYQDAQDLFENVAILGRIVWFGRRL